MMGPCEETGRKAHDPESDAVPIARRCGDAESLAAVMEKWILIRLAEDRRSGANCLSSWERCGILSLLEELVSSLERKAEWCGAYC